MRIDILWNIWYIVYMSKKQTRTMISIRLDTATLELLRVVAKMPGSAYSKKNRTWLIETAIHRQYGGMIANNDKH